MDLPPRQLILTLYGLYARPEGDWLSVQTLIAMMGELGVDAAAVRSSVARLKKRGVLESDRRDGRAGYALAPSTVAMLREGDQRIWPRPRATDADGWLIVVFSVPESERDKRHALRTLLGRLGFGTASPGVWIAPGTLYAEALAAVQRAGLASYTEFFRGDYLGVGSATDRIGEWWDLPAIAAAYELFVETYGAVPGRHRGSVGAFAHYVPMLTHWRRLPYLDPGLPLDKLPTGWPGVAAGELFARLDTELRGPAAHFAHSLLSGRSPDRPHL